MGKLFYKYRPLESWEFLLDILLNKRLFAAHFKHLNDPMEGMFTYSKKQVNTGFIKKLVEEKSRIRICSLSRTCQSTLMWSYYASGHTGIVLGVEPEQKCSSQYDVCTVSYNQKISFKGYYGSDPHTDAKGILSKKLSGWKHEKEIRILTKKMFVPVKVCKLVLGFKMAKRRQKLVETLASQLCPDVQIEKMKQENLDSTVVKF